MAKTILVTGSSGLIGSEVCVYFARELGYQVHGLDNNQRAVFFGPQGDTRWNQRRLQEDKAEEILELLRQRNLEAKAEDLMLALDAAAPVLGAASTLLFTLPDSALAMYLSFFAGFLLYVGIASILIEAHREKSSLKTVLMTILGAAFVFVVSQVI